MCDTSAFLLKNGTEELLISSLEMVRVEDGQITMSNIFGEQKVVSGSIKEVDFVENKVLISE